MRLPRLVVCQGLVFALRASLTCAKPNALYTRAALIDKRSHRHEPQCRRRGSEPHPSLATSGITVTSHSLNAALRSRGGEVSLRSSLIARHSQAIIGVVFMALLEKMVHHGFQSAHIVFPSQLAGCLLLFGTLVLLDWIWPEGATQAYMFLQPGATLLAQWLPVFFVPALVLLPLSPPIGDAKEVCHDVILVFVMNVLTFFCRSSKYWQFVAWDSCILC